MAGLDPAIQILQLPQMPPGYVYILASKRNGTLYTGMTTDLPARILSHREGRGSIFTRRYGINMLFWFEVYDMVVDAIQRETSIKRWPRKWKLQLIERMNPNWLDLYETLNA